MRLYKLLAVLTICVGCLLRLYQSDYSLGGDEIFSVQTAGGSFTHLIDTTVQDRVHPPLYYLFLYPWLKLFGTSETSARTLSVFASLLFLFVLHRLTLRLLTPLYALFVLTVCSISPFFVFYGHDARPYSLIALFSTVSVWLLLRAQDNPSASIWPILYGLSCAALVYTQYLGLLLLLAEFVVTSRSPGKKKIFVYGILGVLSIIPWIFLLNVDLTPQGLSKNLGWIDRPEPFDLSFYYVELFGWLPLKGSTRFLLLASALLILPILVQYRRVDWSKVFFLTFLGLSPPLALLALSRLAPVSVWATRQLIGSAVFLICLVGLGMSFHRRGVGVGLGLVLVLWCVLSLPEGFPARKIPPWRDVVALVHEKCPSCQIVGSENWIIQPFRYYSNREILGLGGDKNRWSNADRIAFLCRLSKCEGLKDLTHSHMVEEVRSIRWGPTSPEPGHTIQVYLLQRTSPALNEPSAGSGEQPLKQ